jgi:hypothetical protein
MEQLEILRSDILTKMVTFYFPITAGLGMLTIFFVYLSMQTVL